MCLLYIFSKHRRFFGKAIYCSKECREHNTKQFHWAECGLLHTLQDDDIGHMALLVYRILVRAGLETLVEISNGDINEISKNALYNSIDYRPVFLQGDHLLFISNFQ